MSLMTNSLASSTGVAAPSSILILDPRERAMKYGIEVHGPTPTDGITFLAGTWSPGGEYTQKLVIKNVSTSTKKIKYKLPATRFFFMLYPEWVILSPGMHTEVDVVFRPVETQPYDDSVFIKVKDSSDDGGFHVPVKAFISKLVLTVPSGLDFGFCATHQTTQDSFVLTNSGEVEAPFRWEVPAPFVLEPMSGVLPVGKSQIIRVSIYPIESHVYVSQAVCYVGEGVYAIIPDPMIYIKLSAIGKYAYICLSDTEVHYGEVLSGTPVYKTKKDIVLRNNSVVPAEFTCVRHEKDTDEVFDISPRSGVIPPQSEIQIFIQYHALAMGSYSNDQYTFKTPGNCHTTLIVTGTSMPPVVSLRKETGRPVDVSLSGSPNNSLNFRDIELGFSSTRLFYLKNNSTREAHFSIDGDEESVFCMQPRQGRIPALSEIAVKLFFKPNLPINYYKRFFILISDGLPLFYECMGTGFIRARGEVKEIRPAPLRHAHIQAYRNRKVRGLLEPYNPEGISGALNPDEMDIIVQHHGMSDMFARIGPDGTRAFSVTSHGQPLTRSGEASRVDTAVAHELFIDDTDPSVQDITLSFTNIDFGFCGIGMTSEARYVTITNRTRGKVMLNWVVPRVRGASEAEVEETLSVVSPSKASHTPAAVDFFASAFVVTPSVEDISPSGSVRFKITFNPKQSNRNYVSDIECFVYFKNQRTFRLTNDCTLTPPWCLTVRSIGHTFATGQLLASGSLVSGAIRSGKLIFPCTYIGDAMFQTVMLRNTSDLPAIFKFELGWEIERRSGGQQDFSTCSDGVFSVKPVAGEVEAENFVLVCIRFTPDREGKCTQLLRTIFNGAPGPKLLLEATGGLPCLRFVDIDEAVTTVSAVMPPRTESAYTRLRTTRATSGLDLALIPGGQLLNKRIPNGFQGLFYMTPTSVGLTTTKKFTLKNTSRLPLKFICVLGDVPDSSFSVFPMSGFLRGNMTIQLTFTFTPKVAQEYHYKLKVKSFPVGGTPSRVVDARQPGLVTPATALQILSVKIVAPADYGAILFDPPERKLDVRLVNTDEWQDLFIENVSDSDIEYFLKYQTEFKPEPMAFGKAGFDDIVDLIPPVPAEAGMSPHALFCNEPHGFIAARSRKKLVTLFRPTYAGTYTFTIIANIRIVSLDGIAKIADNDEAAILRVSNNDPHGLTDRTSELATMPLTASITGIATFPTIIFEDIRAEGCSNVHTDQIWRQFSLSQLNYELGLSLTSKELKLNNASSPDYSKFAHFDFYFTPDVHKAVLQVIYVRIRNCGKLPSSFHLHLPNEKSIELEPWCNADEPTEEGLKQICIIEEMKSFTIEPRHGMLLPGESMTLMLSYNHNYVTYQGIHELSVLLKVNQGKQVILNFKGRTLGAEKEKDTSVTKALLFTSAGTSPSYALNPVPIGLPITETPRQHFEIFNPSCMDIMYELDLSNLLKLSDANFGQPVFRITDPSGRIEKRGFNLNNVPVLSSALVDVYFFPLEVKDYEVELQIFYISAKYYDAKAGRIRGQNPSHVKCIEILLTAKGYDPRIGKPILQMSTYNGGMLPYSQMISYPLQFLYPSHDLIDFGSVPQYCSGYRVVIFRNVSNSDVEFSIDLSQFNAPKGSNHLNRYSGYMEAYPAIGKIKAQTTLAVQITYKAYSSPTSFNANVKVIVRPIVSKHLGQRKHSITTNRSIEGSVEDLSSTGANSQPSRGHSSVVHRSTEATITRMATADLPFGLQGIMPSTVNKQGEVIGSRSRQLETELTLDIEATTDRRSVRTKDHSPTKESIIGGGSTVLSESQSSFKSARTTNSGPRSRSSGSARGSNLPTGDLYGPPHIFWLRVQAQVFTVDTCKRILDSEAKTSDYLVPTNKDFIPLMPRIPLEEKTTSNRRNVSPADIQIAMSTRADELRSLTESMTTALFNELITSLELKEYAESSLAKPTSGLVVEPDWKVSGGPIVGVSFYDLQPKIEISTALIREMRNAGFLSAETKNDCYVLTVSDFLKALQTVGIGPKTQIFQEIREIVSDLYGKGKEALVSVAKIIDGLSTTQASSLYEEFKFFKFPESRRQVNVETTADIDDFDEERQLAQKSEGLFLEKHSFGFMDLAQDVLKNTVYNLIQEALYDEFPISSEPIQFKLASTHTRRGGSFDEDADSYSNTSF